MDSLGINLAKLRNVISNFRIYSETFIDFNNEMKEMIPLAKRDIYLASILKESAYNRFASHELREFQKIKREGLVDLTNKVKVEFKKYGISFLGFESLLNLDSETPLYKDLNQIIVKQPHDSLANEYSELQTLFFDYLKSSVLNQFEESLNKNGVVALLEFPDFFKNRTVYECFVEYCNNHFDRIYIDFSFIIQKMLEQGFIDRRSQSFYLDWIVGSEIISDEQANELKEGFYNNNSLRSLGKSKSKSRESNFNKIFKDCFPENRKNLP